MATASKYSDRVKQEVESLINCLICTDRFEDPKVLPCQHTFCLPCLEHFYKSYNDQRIISVSNFPCPQCRKSVYMPQGGLAALPTDFKVGQIREVFDRINIGGMDLSCDICRFEDRIVIVTSFCAQCSKHLCDTCTGQHANSAVFRSHTTVAIDSAQKDEMVCGIHQEVLKYFCVECKICLCTVCALSKHSKHETIDLATAMSKNRQTISQKIESLKENLVLYENKAEKFAMLLRGRQRQVEKLKETVKKQTRVSIAKLRDEETKLNKEIDAMARKVDGEIDKEICKINVTAREIKSVCDRTDAVLGNGGSIELVNKYDSIVNNLNVFIHPPDLKIDDHFNEEYALEANNRHTLGKLNLHVNENLANEEESSSSKKKGGDNVLGKLKKFEKLANGNGATVSIPSEKTDSIEPDAELTISEPSLETASGESMDSSNDSKPEPKKATKTTKAVTSPDTTQVQTDRSRGAESPPKTPGACAGDPSLIKSKDKLRLLWKTVDNALSRDTAFMEDGTSIVTEYHEGSDKLQIYDTDGNLINSVACSSQHIIKPWGVAVNHQANNIVITDHGDKSVKVFDTELNLKQTWRSLFDKPSGVAVMRNGDYVITDTAKQAFMVSVHTASGIRKREFANRGSGLEELIEPNYVIADHNDRLIISDSALNCIKIYDPRGKLLLKFQAANDPPLQPYGICVDVHNNILVADQSNNVISLFSSDGLFIKNIAQIGEKPFGISVHDNGSMAVASDASLHMLYVPSIRTW